MQTPFAQSPTYSPEFLMRIQRNLQSCRYVRQAWQELYNAVGEKQQAAHEHNAPRSVLVDLQRAYEKASQELSKARAKEEKAVIEYLKVTGGAS